MDISRTTPSTRGPATIVPIVEATNDDKFDAPTALTEKLYGGAEKICDRVTEMRTSHEISTVKRSVAQTTMGEANMMNGRSRVRQKDTRS